MASVSVKAAFLKARQTIAEIGRLFRRRTDANNELIKHGLTSKCDWSYRDF
ncbi:hypothetical protein TorRG33x02_034750 [Trema orientale]|uniref:Uncharacterized protein n=1 Tax=Trema orientale TaxID=63057 RepID=A0A2P5FSU5_TREOI|nr:hypothetical protein TorRG33x02_034750 [Trema orientale]